MDSPVCLSLSPSQLHPHLVLETAAFGVGLGLARCPKRDCRLKRYLGANDTVNPAQRRLVHTAALLNFLISKPRRSLPRQR